VEDNQILSWTLFSVARSGLLSESASALVRRAYHALHGTVTLLPVSAKACSGRTYNRLNEDYRPLHTLCRFFLDHAGPTHETGDRRMLPFLVDTGRLYEMFIAEWLRAHLPDEVSIVSQEKVSIDGVLHFDVDVVLYDSESGLARCVLDTKYKAASAPTAEDVEQVVAYAEAKGCREAFLVYPSVFTRSLDTNVGKIRVRSLTFSPSGYLEYQGQAFMNELLAPVSSLTGPTAPLHPPDLHVAKIRG
jgi:5-methylcytosine-specific restriction enzyme subunit McrC